MNSRYLLTAASLLAIVLAASCKDGNKDKENANPAEEAIREETVAQRFPYENKPVIGNFTSSKVDTLYVEPATEVEYTDDGNIRITMDGKVMKDMDLWQANNLWNIVAKHGSVPRVQLYCDLPCLFFEGDLDGNGTDEIGVYEFFGWGAWRKYTVLTFRGGKWAAMIPSLMIRIEVRDSGMDLVQRHLLPGYAMVTENYNAGRLETRMEKLLTP